MGNWLKNFIDKLAKANEESFHGQIPDCCGTPKPSSSGTAKKPVKSDK